MQLSVNAHGLNALQQRLNALGSELNRKVDIAVGQGAARMQSAVKMLTPVDTGNLRNKIIITHPRMCNYNVETNVDYAMFVEYGTGLLGDPVVPHTNKPSWVYYSTAMARFVITHGQPPAHMFTNGYASTYRDVIDIVDRQVKELLRNA